MKRQCASLGSPVGSEISPLSTSRSAQTVPRPDIRGPRRFVLQRLWNQRESSSVRGILDQEGGDGLRYFGGAVAFGFAAVWITASLVAALVCLAAAVVSYGVISLAERAQAKLAARASGRGIPNASTPAPSRQPSDPGYLALRADELNHDLGRVYEPAGPLPRADEPEYGWPSDEPAD